MESWYTSVMEEQNEQFVADVPANRPWYTRPWLMIGLFVLTIVIVLGAAFAFEVNTIRNELESGTFDFSRLSEEYADDVTARDDAAALQTGGVVTVSEDDDPYLGTDEALVVIVAFEDFECPFCAQGFPEIREIMAQYGDRVRFVFRDFPNIASHTQAQDAALAAECADDQDKFWEMHDKLYQNQPNFTESELKNYAREIGLSTTLFNQCFDAQTHLAEIQNDVQDGLAAGAVGTPTFFVNGVKVQGPISSENWKLIIDSMLPSS